jgi:hypothetical protein
MEIWALEIWVFQMCLPPLKYDFNFKIFNEFDYISVVYEDLSLNRIA